VRQATVLVPTHEHALTLELAVGSALAQTVQDLEVLIVGDGPTPGVRAAAERIEASDPRVRYIPFPKGARHGEASRHEVLHGARGRIVCYLSDDDLWLPDHVEEMARRLVSDDHLVHTKPSRISPDGRTTELLGSASEMLAGRNHIPLSAMGHTLAGYRALRVGWSPAPPDVYTDLHMWRKFLVAGFRLDSSLVPTVLHFPSPERHGRGQVWRRNEILRWWRRIITDPEEVRRALLGGARAP